MQVNNPKYKNIGIHTTASIFTIDNGVVKVLLVKRKNFPYEDEWALVGGAMYNDELVLDAMNREIKEKTGIENVKLEVFGYTDDVYRSKLMRMISINFLGIIDTSKYTILKETLKTSNAEWFKITEVPNLAYDHNLILRKAYKDLRKRIKSSDILRSLYSEGFTMPEIQKVYETILNKEYDRRNFRKKLLSTNLIKETKRTKKFNGAKPAKVYEFIENEEDKIII